MKIEIKHRFSGDVLFSHDQEDNSIKITIELAVNAGANLSDADLGGAYLRGANLREAYLTEADLTKANLSDANLGMVYLRGANLSDADLGGAYLRGADMSDAGMCGAKLRYADLRYADLDGANLRGADLYGADLYGANLRCAYLDGATYGIATLKNGLLQLLGKDWPVYIFDSYIKIGCQMHNTKAWETFNDESISKMDSRALKFWKENKEMILTLAKNHQNKSGE